MHSFILEGRLVRLEPLAHCHAGELALAAAASDEALYCWTQVPRTSDDAKRYIDVAMAAREAGTAVCFAIIRVTDGAVVGSTRFFNIERWSWPQGHPRRELAPGDVCEIGYTWLSQSALRTGINTEAKLLMLTHAFEVWQMLGVCLHTDARNLRSRASIERIGGQLDGILRAHRMGADLTARDSARYSFVAGDWAERKQILLGLLNRG